MQKDDEGLQKHTLNLFEGDYEKIRLLLPRRRRWCVIRRIVRRYIEQVEVTGGSIDAKVEIKI
jgi:hypothetical protein